MSGTRRKKEEVVQETLTRYARIQPLVTRVRSLLDILDEFRQEGDQEECLRLAKLLEPELRKYLFEEKIDMGHPDNLSERAWQAADYITDILPRVKPATPQPTPPAPATAPRPAAQAERPRIVTPRQEGSAFRAENRSDFLAPPEPQPPQPAEVIYAGYMLMPRRSTYAHGVQALRRAFRLEQNADPRHRFVRPDGSWLYRPLTLRETIQARVESYERSAPEDRLKLFLKWEDSCTGAAYKARTTKFKLIPQCEPLITIPADFNGYFLNVSYNTWDVPELDSAAPGTKFNQQLTPHEVEENEGWRAAVENDLPLLRTFRDIVWDACERRFFKDDGPARFMGFYVRQNTPTDELRPLFVRNLNFNSLANYGAEGANLDDGGSFLRVAP